MRGGEGQVRGVLGEAGEEEGQVRGGAGEIQVGV